MKKLDSQRTAFTAPSLQLDSRHGDHEADVLKRTLAEVECDETEAIETLCSLLETIETSRDFSSLGPVREVVKQWQNRPPRGIVTDLKRIGETLKCQGRDNT